MADEDVFEIEGNEVSLADIAGLNVDDIAEKRASAFPAGIFDFEVVSCALDSIGDKKKFPVATGKFKILNVVKLDDPTVDAAALEGTEYTENFFLSDFENMGQLKAMVVDTGCKFDSGAKYAQMLEAWESTRFRGRIRHKKDKNDSDVVYANIVKTKVVPWEKVQAAQAA